MAVFNAAFPILPGKVEAARAFGREAMGERRSEFEAYQRRRGITRETWSVQETPDGNAFSVVWFESSDSERALAEGIRDTSDFGRWFRERVQHINGVDLEASQALPPLPEVTLDWSA